MADLRKGNKKKVKSVGEQPSGDLKNTATHDEVSQGSRQSWMSMRKDKETHIGGYAKFGDSETKSLGRAMQENKNKNLADELASKITDEQMEALKKRARERASKK